MQPTHRMPELQENHDMHLRQVDLRHKTKRLSLHGIQVFQLLPTGDEAQLIGKRMLRHLTRVGASYRAAIRSRHRRTYFRHLDATLFDLDIAAYWLELLIDAGYAPKAQMQALLQEVHELMAILVSYRKTVKKAGNRLTSASSN